MKTIVGIIAAVCVGATATSGELSLGFLVIAGITYAIVTALWDFLAQHKAAVAVVAVLALVFAGKSDAAGGLMYLLGVVIFGALFIWAAKAALGGGKKSAGAGRPARRQSMPTRMANSAGDAVGRGLMNFLTPKGPTPDELARREAEKQYWFHQKQADRLKGTKDGDWHQNQAWHYRNKMK